MLDVGCHVSQIMLAPWRALMFIFQPTKRKNNTIILAISPLLENLVGELTTMICSAWTPCSPCLFVLDLLLLVLLSKQCPMFVYFESGGSTPWIHTCPWLWVGGVDDEDDDGFTNGASDDEDDDDDLWSGGLICFI